MDFYFIFLFCTYKSRLLFCMVIVLMVVVGFYWSYIWLTVRFSLNWYARRCAIDVWPRCIFVICLQSVAFQNDCRSNAVIVWDYVLRMLTFVGLDPSLWFCQEHWGLRGSLLLFSSLNLRARYFLLFLEASYSFRIASSAAARGSHCFRV